MSENYTIRCSSSVGRTMAGIFFGSLTTNGIVATWKQERARRFDSRHAAIEAASRLGRNFSGTTWEVIGV
jgi:hypothetical protein